MENYHTNQRRRMLPGNPQNLPLRERPFTPRPPETILAEEKVIVERKSYHISRRENARGQFIVISEERLPVPTDSPGFRKSNRIIVPVSGLADFIQAIQTVSIAPQ